jgi:hypothetical protein
VAIHSQRLAMSWKDRAVSSSLASRPYCSHSFARAVYHAGDRILPVTALSPNFPAVAVLSPCGNLAV